MSGAQTSSFADPNILYKSLSGLGTAEVLQKQNDLLQQQQTIGAGDTEMAARIASTLQSLPTSEARASAYPTMLAQARANGYRLPHAPETYPGDDAIAATARLGTPSQTQQEWQANIAANKAYTSATATPQPGTGVTGTTAPAATAPATGGTGGDGLTGDKAHDLPLIAQRESGGSPTVLNYVAQQDPTAYARGATASGKYQIVNSTWREGMQLAGLDPAQYATARDAPESVQDRVASAIYDKYGAKPWQKGPQDWVKDEQGRYQMATVRPPAGAPGGAPAIAPPGTPPVAPTTPPPYRVASNAPAPPPVSAAPASGQPQPQAQVPQPPAPTTASAPRVDSPGAPAATPQPQAQVPQPPPNRVMPGSADGPPAPTPPPAPQPSAPAGGPAPPQLPPLNARGLTAQQQAQIDAVASTGRMTVQQRMAAEQAFVNQNIQLQQKAFSDYVQMQQLAVSQGQLTNAQAETNLKYWQAAHPELAPNAREATIAYRTLQELAPAMRAPNPPQDVIDRYNNAAVAYQDFKTITDPISKGTVQVPSRPMPEGFPPPTGGPGGGAGVRTLIPGMSPAQQEVEKKLGENFADQDTKAYAGANNSLYALGQMNNASEILDKQGGSAWTATGPAANLRIATAQGVNTLGSLFGVAPTFDPAAIGSWEALNKQTKLMGFKIINAAFGASREAASVINNATSAVPSAENTYLGFRLVSSGIEQELQRERELYEFKADRVRGGQPLATAEADFNKAHPIDVYTSRAVANAVPDDIAGYLVAHPDTVKAFDGHFGPGTGEFILKGGRTGLGQAARGR